jgi:hypothetical protein
MKQDQDRSKTDRRSFLKLAGLGTVGTVAAAASTVSATAAESKPKSDSAYRETDHVRRAYDLARF